MNDFTIPLITVTFLAAGIVKGVTGMGLPSAGSHRWSG